MRKLRETTTWSVRQTAKEYGRSAAHISRVERGGSPPTRELVQFYEDQFEGDGLLLSLFEVVSHAPEQRRRLLARGRDPRRVHAFEGDASTFVDDTVPHGT